MRKFLIALGLLLAFALPGQAQETGITAPQAEAAQAQITGLAAVLAEYSKEIAKPSRRTIGPVIAAIAASGEGASRFLQAYADKRVGQRESDGAFFIIEKKGGDYALSDPATGAPAGTAPKSDIKEIKPNSGVRAEIGAALVRFLLSDPDPKKRRDALTAIERDGEASHLEPLRASIPDETDPAIKAEKVRLERLLTIRFGKDAPERVAAIESFGSDLGLDFRATLNPLVATTRTAFAGAPEGNVADALKPGRDISKDEAYAMLVAAKIAPARISASEMQQALAAHVEGGQVGGLPLAAMADPAKREEAYATLAAAGIVPQRLTDAEADKLVTDHQYADIYAEPDPEVTTAADAALTRVGRTVAAMQTVDLGLDALSLASIYFLAAIGLAITFGVMGVINMAHGEFITMGAYTGYVVQLFVPDYTASILIALPLAFAITFGAGVAMERLVIRWLYKRPLETLLATFGISIALQQLFKNIFGTQARPLTSPPWLDGAWTLNDVVSISYIRIAIFVLALIFLALYLWVMRRTRLGLEVRAVTQNPSMAASMGINPDRINMLAFGFGSGIAGIAGVAIGLFAKVTSEMGQDYIVQSFMTVVVGGVGSIFGTLAGAGLIGVLQKGIEWLNPSNTLAAQTYMILFIIIFIQFRPRGIIALKGRAAGD
ncbi:urea ABC transporter permease subunit UrtB [Thioclava marina]|uniref:Urea ABC transporter permease subunit UrtB n=1 Tax=Thioclava marina TaxID=1915077 RepID=A0ABX3MJB2_9RHOB|nr:urea ABC transporter permease subunit UrtB [Thioclava marina]OOY11608.1 urea ABC transporter permease subunit UrtB [Thioclava marina]